MKIFNYEITIRPLSKDDNKNSHLRQTMPKIGDLYFIPMDKTPFPDLNNIETQVIIDVKDGYVRHNHSTDSVFSDNVTAIKDFLKIYKKY